jgi:hypothetical protein
MLHQDRDFSMIDAIKRQFKDRLRREKIVLFIWGQFWDQIRQTIYAGKRR